MTLKQKISRIAPFFTIALAITSSSCDKEYIVDFGAENFPGAGTWLVNEDYIQWGCPAKDCIPSLTNPELVAVGESGLSYLDDADLVVGIAKDDGYIAVPHPILDWHEVVNMDDYSISYCPLTGSAIHILDDHGFGVSGLLYNSNLIMYDKETDSFWPQMLLAAASGSKRGEKMQLDRMVETTWGTWRKLFPSTLVVSSQTGHNRNYNSFPYGAYRSDRSIFFPIENFDDRLHAKERIVGILNNDEAKVYKIDDFGTFSVVHDEVGGIKYAIFGSTDANFAVAFESDQEFSIVKNDLENGQMVFADAETGTEWNILGEAISGPLEGEQLEVGDSFISYWFAWAAFYPETQIWEKGQ